MKYAIISSGIIGIALARLGAFANQVAISNTVVQANTVRFP